MAALTGARLSELDDLGDAELEFGWQVDRYGSRRPTKTERSARIVPIPKELESCYAQPPDFMFCTRTGRPFGQRNAIRAIRTAQRRAKDEDGDPTFPELHVRDEQGRRLPVPRGALPSVGSHRFDEGGALAAVAATNTVIGCSSKATVIGKSSTGMERAELWPQLGLDHAAAASRPVGATTPSASAALQNAKRFRRVHVQRVERAAARAGQRLDEALGRDPGEPVTIDLDATRVTVYGCQKEGAARSRHGSMSYAPHVAFWAQRGRALTSELVAGNQDRLCGRECALIATRAIRLLGDDNGPVRMRIDSAY